MTRDDDFLARWSRRKHAAKRGEATPPAPPERLPAPPAIAESRGPQAAKPEELPAVESLTPESDFSPFMQKEVDPALRRQALKTLFRDPRFNVMDGLDVYIDDYSKPDPIPADWLGKLNQLARLGDYRLTEEREAEAKRLAESQAAAVENPPNQDLEEGAPVPVAAAPEPGSPERESKQS